MNGSFPRITPFRISVLSLMVALGSAAVSIWQASIMKSDVEASQRDSFRHFVAENCTDFLASYSALKHDLLLSSYDYIDVESYCFAEIGDLSSDCSPRSFEAVNQISSLTKEFGMNSFRLAAAYPEVSEHVSAIRKGLLTFYQRQDYLLSKAWDVPYSDATNSYLERLKVAASDDGIVATAVASFERSNSAYNTVAESCRSVIEGTS